MFGVGLLAGMLVTLKAFFGKKDTVQYPDVKISMTSRFRGGVIDLNIDKCIACGLCALACPNEAILLTAAKTEDNKKKLASYYYLSSYCLFCNLCIEACPTKAIVWDKNYEIASYYKEFLTYDCLARSAMQPKHTDSVNSNIPVKISEGGVSLGG